MTEPLWRSRGARLRRWQTRGLDLITLENSRVRISVAVNKGGEFVEFVDKTTDVDHCWFTERGPVAAHSGVPSPDPRASFHDWYTGGWQEAFPSGGSPSRHRGAPLGQHSELALLPGHLTIEEDTAETVGVELRFELPRFPFVIRKKLRLGLGPRLEVSETIENRAPVEVEAMWGQHLAFGSPFLEPGCRIRVPSGATVIPQEEGGLDLVARDRTHTWPHAESDSGDPVDLSVVRERNASSGMLYLADLSAGWYELVKPDEDTGVRVEWDREVLPYLWIWQELGATTDYPFWGEYYVLGLEPFSSIPNTGLEEAVANGTALTFPPHGRRTLDWSVELIG